MRGTIGILAFAALLGGCGSADETPAPAPSPSALALASASVPAEPDLAQCKEGKMADSELLERKQPLAVPPQFEGIAKSNLTQFAVSAMAGNTICVDTSWIESIETPKLSPDGRFLAFGWLGYEAFGYVVVDRSGKGQVIDTGNAPLSPPSGMRFAAIDLGEAGFGALNAFAVWDIEPTGLKQVAHFDEGLPSGEWRIDGWQGDDCVKLAVLPLDRFPADGSDIDKVPRDPWFAAKKNKWKPAAGSCPKA